MSQPEYAENDNLQQLDALNKRLGGQTDPEDAPELEEREAPGVLRFMPPLLQEFWRRKAYFTIQKDGSIEMDGFYKNGALKIQITAQGTLVAIDRRGREVALDSFDDLVALNYQWWAASNTKTQYVVPGRPFLDYFIEQKRVKRKVIYLPAEAVDADEGESE